MVPLQQSSALAPRPLGTMAMASATIPRIAVSLRIAPSENIGGVILIPLRKPAQSRARLRNSLVAWRMKAQGKYGTRNVREHLTVARSYRYTKSMAQTFLIFDFGSDEELAQQARHRIDGWKQGFRLDKKVLLKFDRSETAHGEGESEEKAAAKASRKKGAKAAKDEKDEKENIQLIIRLDFSDHERLSHQRWVERIPSEAPFKDTQSKVIRQNDAEFAGTAERFESLPDDHLKSKY